MQPSKKKKIFTPFDYSWKLQIFFIKLNFPKEDIDEKL
jgi:hypothetical protein